MARKITVEKSPTNSAIFVKITFSDASGGMYGSFERSEEMTAHEARQFRDELDRKIKEAEYLQKGIKVTQV